MGIVYKENETDAMTDGSTASAGMQATCCSVCLREKLNKLIQTLAMTEAMDIDTEELKKCTRAFQPQTKWAETPNPTAGDNRAPKVKRNNKVPPPNVKAKALFIQRHTNKIHNDMASAELDEAAQETHPTLKELTEVDEDDINRIMEQPADTNNTVEVTEAMKQQEGGTIAQSTEQDT